MNKRIFTGYLLTVFALTFQTQAHADDGPLQKLWETPGFSNPESVIRDQ